jgi:hypothetical protein
MQLLQFSYEQVLLCNEMVVVSFFRTVSEESAVIYLKYKWPNLDYSCNELFMELKSRTIMSSNPYRVRTVNLICLMLTVGGGGGGMR